MKHYNDIAAEDYYEMALEWIRARNPVKAADCLKQSIELNRHFTYAYVTLARVQSGAGAHGEAFHTLKKAAMIDPSFDRLYYLMAKYAYRGGDYPAALRAIDRALEKSPSLLYQRSRTIILRAMEALQKRKNYDC